METKNQGDIVNCIVYSEFGTITVDYQIIVTLSKHNQIYLAYAKETIGKIQLKADGNWYLNNYINIKNLTMKNY